MYSKSLFIISILAFTSCTNSSQKMAEDKEISIPIDITNALTLDYNDLVGETNFVALETTDESIIGNIEKVILYDNNIIIFDQKTNKILLFSQDGSFKRQIGQKGGGPDEYTEFNEIFLDEPSGLIYAHERIKNIMFVYNLEGKIVYKINPRFKFNSFCKTKDGFWLYTCFENNNPNGYNLMLVDEKMQNMIGGYFPQHPNFINVEWMSRFRKNEAGEFFFTFPTSNCIYKLDAKTPETLCKIDFGNKTAPYDIIAKMETHKEYDKLLENDYYMLGDYYFWGSILIFTFRESSYGKPHTTYSGFYDLNKLELNIYNGIAGSTMPTGIMKSADGSKLIFSISPFEMYGEQSENIEKQIGKKLDDDSNPVLIIRHLKKLE